MFAALFLGLLQAASAAESLSNAEYVRSSLTTIGDSLSLVDVPGSARQIAINSLLRDVAEVDKISPDANDTLGNVSTLLESILDEFKVERENHQSILDEVIDEVGTCNTYWGAVDTMLSENVTNLRTKHRECRDDEQVLFDQDQLDSSSLVNLLESYRLEDDTCASPASTSDDVWQAYLADGLGWFSAKQQQFAPMWVSSKDAYAAWKVKNQACHLKQKFFEESFCTWRTYRTMMCASLDECYNAAVDLHLIHRNSIKPNADNRTRLAAAILHILCLVDKLRHELPLEPVDTVCPFQDTMSLTDYNNTYPSIPVEGQCTLDSIAVYPGHSSWDGQEYDFLVEHGMTHNTGISC